MKKELLDFLKSHEGKGIEVILLGDLGEERELRCRIDEVKKEVVLVTAPDMGEVLDGIFGTQGPKQVEVSDMHLIIDLDAITGVGYTAPREKTIEEKPHRE